MAVKKYLDDQGLETLVKLIKKNTAKVYKIRGSAVYADADYVTHAAAGDDGYHSAITSEGLWQLIDGTWTKITEFEEGWVYNIENTFKTSADFIEGAGSTVEAGSNIVVAEASGDPVEYKWDQLGNVLDMDDYQTKKLVSPLTVFSATDGTAVEYASSSALPASQTAATGTVNTYDIAIITGDDELGDVYRAIVTENASDATLEDIAWVKLGDQLTVEGALELLSKMCPNTPITDEEIEDIWNRI